MPGRAAVAVAFLVVAGGAAATVPLVTDGPLLEIQLALPEFGADASGHAGHAGHGALASARAPAKAAHAHGAPPAGGSAAASDDHAGHGSAAEAGDAAPDATSGDHAAHGDHAGGLGDQPGMQRPAFPPATGSIPDGPEGLTKVSNLRIDGDAGFEDTGLPITGSGTLADPYVLRGLAVTGELALLDTDACVVITENWISGQLALNWNGQCVWVHHNFVRDLRVNENIQRDGYATGGLIEDNGFGVLGQLRHFDGEFRENTVGPFEASSFYDPVRETVLYDFLLDRRVANIDGFNQGLIHHNTFLGTVDLDFHGHHHGTGFFAPHSHYHGSAAGRQKLHEHDHADRWTSVAFTDNVVDDPEGYGLRYEDRNHAGDDRRATSEDMDVLNGKHVHHTDVVLARNTIRGHLWVDVFNADDANHPARNPGTLTIADNHVTVEQREDEDYATLCQFLLFGEDYDAWSAIHIQAADDITAHVLRNRLAFVPLPGPPGAQATLQNTAERALHECGLWPDDRTPVAIRLEQVTDGDVLVQGNVAAGFQVGVAATWLEDTAWRVAGNDFGRAQPVRYDDTVEEPPVTS